MGGPVIGSRYTSDPSECMIEITDTAAEKIKSLMAKQGISRWWSACRRQGRRLLRV